MTVLAETSHELTNLLKRSALGDQQAFATLYQKTAPTLLAMAISIVKVRALAEEALQDAFVQSWRDAPSFAADKGAPMAWLTGIVRHRALDLRRREVSQYAKAAAVAQEPEPTPAPLDAAERAGYSSDLQALLKCLDPLQPQQRESLLMAYYYGYSHSEVSARLGLPLGTVKAWIRRGMLSVRECLQL